LNEKKTAAQIASTIPMMRYAGEVNGYPDLVSGGCGLDSRAP
jgi:hypothetical protein